MTIGIIFALIAMLCWGFGDFMIQRFTRKFGNWETLFLITAVGVVILLPFVWRKIPELFSSGNALLSILFGAGMALFIAALLEFEALRQGKIFVIEPTWSLEIPASALLAFFILGEKLTSIQITVITVLIIGLFLLSYRGKIFSTIATEGRLLKKEFNLL